MRQVMPLRKSQRGLTAGVAAVVTGFMLAGCGQQPTESPPPGNAPHALVLGQVSSYVYDELKKSVRMTSYSGSERASDHDLVILDGDTTTPEAVQTHPLVREALQAGKAVLLLDASESHKREGLGRYLGFASKNRSPGYLARLTQDRNGRAEVRVVEFPHADTLKFSGGLSMGALTLGAVQAFAAQVLASMNVPRTGLQDGYSPYPCGGNPNTAALHTPDLRAQDGTGETIPAGAIYKHVYYCVPVQWQAGNTLLVKGTQNVYFNTNYTFTIILDNGNEPQGNFQWVAAQMDVTAVPSGTPTSGVQPILSDSEKEKGWFQDRIRVGVQPVSATSFSSQSDSPANANNVTQVTTSTSFNVAFTTPNSANVTGGYSNSQTVNIPDWQVTNNSVGVNKAWDFKTLNPIDADNLNGGFAWTDMPKTPNGLSMTQLQFSAQASWRTGGVQTGWTDFNAYTEQDVADLACSLWTQYGCQPQTQTGGVRQSPDLSLYLGAVVPVPIQAITFSQNPAPVITSGTVTGTIVLSAPAPEDITIPLSSNDPTHAVVPPTVTVQQGETSASFPVAIISNGGAVGTTFGVVISAFYAQNYLGTLNIKNVSILPPTTAPSYDPLDWYDNAPQGSRWVVGYQVRYAVTFVDAAGNETDRGPWTNWFSGNYVDNNGTPQAYVEPKLINIATDPTGKAVARNVYRQFLVDYSSTNPSAGVTKVLTLNDNTTTSAADTNIPQ
ncbi:hypothetical protein [Deinococcus apachensis]|uniref:hypothetical protein n=1 Tax=Deinococcus apachensis TaxID=309886 RepID=UPI0003652280|nr:hypothetical protein [Deinococcus apachensis]